tara:strand:+ start:84 stop:962 length:879 start_codon:yes stop_codon:yes gene_type:complete
VKTYISAGIGDMVSVDALLTKEEKENITEIFWACRWGKALFHLFINNQEYPNLQRQHVIEDKVGMENMVRLEPEAASFWHFRPDFPANYAVGLSLFNLSKDEVNAIDTVGILYDSSRKYQGSSFLTSCTQESVAWEELNIKPNKYILVHYPTAARSKRNDIAKITNSDWQMIEDLSTNTDLDVVIISDREINHTLSRGTVLVNYNIKSIVTLAKYAEYFVGCDSFVSQLACKDLSPTRMYVKGHDYQLTHGRPISEEIRSNVYLQQHYTPHSVEDIVSFYTSELTLKPGDIK